MFAEYGDSSANSVHVLTPMHVHSPRNQIHLVAPSILDIAAPSNRQNGGGGSHNSLLIDKQMKQMKDRGH